VPSASEEGVMHRVTLAPEHCDRKGFQYRGRCRHIKAVVEWYETRELEEPSEDVDEDATLDQEVTMARCEVYSAMVHGEGARPSVRSARPGQVNGCRRRQATALQSRARRSAMSTLLRIALPEVNPADAMREAQWQHLKACVREDDVWIRFQEHLDLVSNAPKNAVARTFAGFMEMPPQDVYELQGIIAGMRLKEKVALADAVLECLGSALLSVATDVETRTF